MATPSARTWLAALPETARREATTVRKLIVEHLPDGYEETVAGKMLVYQVPLQVYPDTYNGQPLMYAALATGKTGLSLHLLPLYFDPALAEKFRASFAAAGKNLNMGMACVRFKKADDLALDVVADLVGKMPMKRFVAAARAARTARAPAEKKKKTTTKA